MYIGHLNFQPKSFLCPYNLRDPFPTNMVVTENAIYFSSHFWNNHCTLALISLPLFQASLTKSIGGIPHLSKTNITILLLFFLVHFSFLSLLWSLPLCLSDILWILSLSLTCKMMRLFGRLLSDPNQHKQVNAVKTYKGESPEEVSDPLVTLSPRGVAVGLAVWVSVQSVEQMAGVLGREQQVSACMSPGWCELAPSKL